MNRTNIYLTSDQQQALDARARQRGTSRSAVIRHLIDREIASMPTDDSLDDAFQELADVYGELVGSMFDDDPDLRIDR